MGNEWDEMASKWDTMPGTNEYNAAFVNRLKAEGVSIRDAKVLDFGCGSGIMTELLQKEGAKRIVALDISAKMVEMVAEKVKTGKLDANVVVPVNLDLTESTVEEVKQVAGGDSFDVIVASSSLGFCPDYEQKVKLLAGSLLRSGGVLMHTDWDVEGTDESGLTISKIEAALNQDPSIVGQAKAETKAFSVAIEDQKMEPLLGFLKKK